MSPLVDWLALKTQLVEVTNLDKDALHIYFAVVLQLGAATLLRRTLADWRPWALVLVAALANEWSDLQADFWPDRALQYREAAHDMVNTMLLPTLLLVLARWRPRLLGSPAPVSPAGEPDVD